MTLRAEVRKGWWRDGLKGYLKREVKEDSVLAKGNHKVVIMQYKRPSEVSNMYQKDMKEVKRIQYIY